MNDVISANDAHTVEIEHFKLRVTNAIRVLDAVVWEARLLQVRQRVEFGTGKSIEVKLEREQMSEHI